MTKLFCIKHFQDVPSNNFGETRTQVTLHTEVMYTKAERDCKLTVNSICTIYGNNFHNPVSIYLHPVISALKADYPQITKIHFFSEIHATQ